MDIYTKLFLANLIAMFFTAAFDRYVLNDALEDIVFTRAMLGLWALATFISMPAWIIYVIVSW